MAVNFRIHLHRNDNNVHVKLTGDFDGSSAYELINVLKNNKQGSSQIFIHTSGLNKIHPFGLTVFRNNFKGLNEQTTSFIFTGENDLDIMHNSASINLHFAESHAKYKRLFYSSSACVYPQEIQEEIENNGLKEEMAYPANPDSEYGWEKLFGERLYLTLMKNKGVPVRIARFHNIYGPEGTWRGGREKAPAAMARKVAELPGQGGEIEVWGDGEQTRSFLYIEECLEGVRRLMESDFTGPVNIGSEEDISINDLALMCADIADKEITLRHIDGPLGVRGRNSENALIQEQLDWGPDYPLRRGMEKTYAWINEQVGKSNKDSN